VYKIVFVGQDITDIRIAERARSVFLAAVSHELRTPLNYLLGAMELVIEGSVSISSASSAVSSQQTSPKQSTSPIEEIRGLVQAMRTAAVSDGAFPKQLASSRLSRHHSKLLHDASTVGELLLHLINNVLDLCKADAGQLKIVEGEVDLVALVRHCVDIMNVLAKKKQLSIELDPPASLPRVRGDDVRLRQVVLNLVSNAIKFTDSGSIQVKVKVIQESDFTCQLMVRVIDTGIGVPEQHRAKLFQLFSKCKESDHMLKNSTGAGLGLAISKQLVEAMGGQIGLVDNPSNPTGSCFWFSVPLQLITEPLPSHSPAFLPSYASPTLPVCSRSSKSSTSSHPLHALQLETLDRISIESEEEPECGFRETEETSVFHVRSTASSSAVSDVACEPIRILLVDDNDFNVQVMTMMLTVGGHRVTSACNGAEGVEKFAASIGGFDVVIMDCEMPVMNGFEATRAIRDVEKQRCLRPTPIVAVTAFAMPTDRNRCISAGMDDYTTKPVSKSNLLALVEKWHNHRMMSSSSAALQP
jgi:signal transduction histidine kinase/CheY-like chemotaxis protein